jgi:hypothetical protein
LIARTDLPVIFARLSFRFEEKNNISCRLVYQQIEINRLLDV